MRVWIRLKLSVLFLSLCMRSDNKAQGFVVTAPKAAPLSSQMSASTSTSNNVKKNRHSRQIWREKADPKIHRDFMIPRHAGGQAVERPRDNLLPHYVYFLRLDSDNVLIFQGMSQVHQCRSYFLNSSSSTRKARWFGERDHGEGPWYCRLPKGITQVKRRQRILKLLDELIQMYGDDHDFVYHRRRHVHQGFEDRTAWIEENKRWREDFRSKLRMSLLSEQFENGDENLSHTIWVAIGKQVWADKFKYENNDKVTDVPAMVKQLLNQDIEVADKALPRMTPPPERKIGEPSSPRLSKFRQKRLAKQQARDKAILNESIGPPIRALSQILEDTINCMIEYRRLQKGSSSLAELEKHQKEVKRVGKIISDYYFRYESIARAR